MAIIPNLVLFLLSSITVVSLIHSKVVMGKVPQSVSWAGLREEILSKTRACIRELTAELRTLNLGYEKVRDHFSPYPALLMVSFCSSIKKVYFV